MTTQQLGLPGVPGPEPRPPLFGGSTYVPERDAQRLGTQLAAVRQILLQGDWWRLGDLTDAVASLTGCMASQTGVSARVRDLRKHRFGGYQVEKRALGRGVWLYHLVSPDTSQGATS